MQNLLDPMPDANSTVLELENLGKTYKKSHLGRTTVSRGIENISLQIKQGEVFGLLGPNGAGKTTMIKLILGLLFPTSGQVKIYGVPAHLPEARKRVGFLPEVPYFYKYLTAREVLKFYGNLSLINSAILPERINEALKLVRMNEHADRPMREYSKGMLQRVGLAQAMLHNPDLLIFDEPAGGLDPVGIREMRELILTQNESGKTVFFSSHSISEIEKVCDRVAIIVRGKLKQVVELAALRDKAQHLEELFIKIVTEEMQGAVK